MKNYIIGILNIILLIIFMLGIKKGVKFDKIIYSRKNNRSRLSESIIDNLCLNTYEGRRVGSRGNEKAAEYIKDIFEDMGLSTYCKNTYYEEYYQEVLLKESEEMEEGEKTNKNVKNVIGILEGTNKDEAVVISAHFDTIGSINSRIIKGALDNASGIAVLILLVEEIKKYGSLRKNIIFACFNGEETGLQGSKYFVEHIKGRYKSLYNINIDCVCGRKAGLISLENSSEISKNLTQRMQLCFNENNYKFSNIAHNSGTSDHESFENAGIPNIYIGQDKANLYIHNYYDTPESIDCDEIDKLSLCLCDFLIRNDNIIF